MKLEERESICYVKKKIEVPKVRQVNFRFIPLPTFLREAERERKRKKESERERKIRLLV